jgi:hypothetical protein
LPPQSVTSDEVLPPKPSNGNAGNTPLAVTLSPDTKRAAVDWNVEEALAAIPDDHPERGRKIAQVRAEDARRRRATR